nr:hypothetical protein [Tanacetum cinerariifolium]
CSSCGALYTRDCCCSKGNVEDKILVPKPPKNCARCGHPVDGSYCQGCALLRKKLEEDLVTHFQDFQNTFKLSDDSTDVVNAPREPFVVKQDHRSFEPDNSLSMGDEHLDTILATESDEVIKSSVENLVPIPSESKGTPDTMCDVHLVNNPTRLEAKDHFEIIINSNNDYSSSDDDYLYNENIEYVEASPHDSELVSLEKETNTFDNSLPEFENFFFNLEEISSGSTTTHSDISLPDYEAFSFYDDHIEEISSGSTTTHSDISLFEYDSFIFDLSNDQFPPTDRSDFTHEEFPDELAYIISPPEYDCFYFGNLPDPGEWMSSLYSGICENLSSTTRMNLPVEDDHPLLLAYVVWIFLAYLTIPGNVKTLAKGFCTQVFISSS